MKYGLIVEKLNLIDEKFITSNKIKEFSNTLKMSYADVITYLTRYKYLIVILKGIFYKPSIIERKRKIYDINYREALIEALKIKGIKKWYFGLETAIKINNLTHEFFVIDYIINDTITRTKTTEILGNKIKFIKLKPKLFNFGIKKHKNIKYSDIEKTVLDIIYLNKYAGLNDENIKEEIKPYLKHCSKNKLKEYAKKYNKKIEVFIATLWKN